MSAGGAFDRDLASRVLGDALSQIEPKDAGEIWEWGERRLRLEKTPTSRPGRLSFSSSPYMIGEWSPLWAWKRYKYIANIWGAQLGKTLLLCIILAYICDIEPGPVLVTMPDQNFARGKSKKDIKPFILDNLSHLLTGDSDDFSNLEYIFRNLTVTFAWTGSASSMAGYPCRYVLNDECGKNQQTESEGDSFALADRRLTSYGPFGRNYEGTTPSLRDRAGWRELIAGTWCERRVPCHACFKLQVMRWNGALPEFDAYAGEIPTPGAGGFRLGSSDLSLEERARATRYHCIFCDAPWNDAQKDAAEASGYEQLILERMIAAREAGEVPSFHRFFDGFAPTAETPIEELHLQALKIATYAARWAPRYPERERYSSQLPSWYSPMVTLAQVAGNYLRGLSDRKIMMDHLNSDRAEASDLEEEAGEMSADELKRRIYSGSAGIVPVDDAYLILTADIHKNHCDYRVRAWQPGTLTSWGIETGVLPVLDSAEPCAPLAPLFDKAWSTPDGRRLRVDAAFIDSSYLPVEVQSFCLRYPSFCFPIQGRAIRGEFLARDIHITDPTSQLSGTLREITFADDQAKDRLASSLRSGTYGEPGFFYFESGLPDRFWKEMQGEKLITEDRDKGQVKRYWKRVGANHAFDLEKYQILGARVLGLHNHAVPAPRSSSHAEVFNPYTNQPVA